MAFDYLQFPLTRGLDRSIAPCKADRGSFYDLFNFRQAFLTRGRLVQTPYFYVSQQPSVGTYYDGGSQTEPSSSLVHMYAATLIMTSYVLRRPASTQIQTFYQTTVPADDGITKGCRLVINDVSALGITLGSTLEVEIDAATTFQWRKNGGAWTTGVAIATDGVDIDGGNATLYFLTDTGFTVGDDFIWTRLDRSYGTGTLATRMAPHTYYKDSLYFISRDYRLMVAETTSTLYAISVGYRPVYGSYFTFYDDHLVVGAYSPVSTSTVGERGGVIGWSDKTDVHNFTATSTNEADTFTLPNQTTNSNVAICGVAVINQQLYAFTMSEVYITSALGLPFVFSFSKFTDLSLKTAGMPIIESPGGVYVNATHDVLFFDGGSFRALGFSVGNSTGTANVLSSAFGMYHPGRQELVLVTSDTLYCYQERWGEWYSRASGFSANGVTALYTGSSTLIVGTSDRRILSEDTSGANAPVFDSASGTVYATPKITTQMFGDRLAEVKEVNSVYVAAKVTSADDTVYTTDTDLVVKAHWYTSDVGEITGSPSTDASATWTSASPDGLISLPRVAFRAIAFELQLVGTVSKPPGLVTVAAIEPLIRIEKTTK